MTFPVDDKVSTMMNMQHLFRLALVAIATASLTASGCTLSELGGSSSSDNQSNSDNQSENDGQNDDQDDRTVTTETLLDDDEITLANGYSDTIEIEVPDDVLSIAINVSDGPEDDSHFVTDWESPDGFEMVPDGWETDGDVCYPDCANRVMQSAGASGALAPNNPDAEAGVEPGTHSFRVGTRPMSFGRLQDPERAQSSDTVRVSVFAEVVGEEVPDEGTLDLNLFFTGANDWDAETAPDDPEVQGIIADIDDTYDQVGIDIGEVAYHDVDDGYQYIQDGFSGSGDLAQMYAHSAEAELEGPSVFFVEELMGGFGVLGIAGGIPGPMIIDGTPSSGVAIGVSDAGGPGAPGVANVTAHELGHYLGLYHTSEHNGGWGGGGGDSMPSHDPLPDTEEDDTSYLMHASGDGNTMSEWQGRVMRNNPWVYHD